MSRRHRTQLLLATAIVFLLTGAAPFAQTPVLLIHGIFSDDTGWDAVINRLSSLNVAVDPHAGNYQGWPYEVQAGQVQGNHAGKPNNTIAVGHSNGGIVARMWSHQHNLGGVITIGAPHLGVPLLHQGNINDVINFTNAAIQSLADVVNTFSACWNCPVYGGEGTWDWIYDDVGPGIGWIANTSGGALQHVLYNIFRIAEPVVLQMDPNAAFLANALNSAAELANERNAVGVRVAIGSMAHNYSWGGVLRAASPGNGDGLAYTRDVIRESMLYYRDYLGYHAHQYDYHARSLARVLNSAAGFLGAMDYVWCYNVSFPSNFPLYGNCAPNDTLVPFWSQVGWATADPGVNQVWVGDGPAHTQMRGPAGAHWIHYAMTQFMNIPPPGGGGGGDALGFWDIDYSGGSFPANGDVSFVGWEWNDRISSIRVPPGRTVVLYQALELRGRVVGSLE